MINFVTRSKWGLILVVLAITAIAHASYINNGFTWLDHGDIEFGRTILPIDSLLQAWVSRLGETQFYRPVVTIVNSLDFLIYQTVPWGFHLTNVLLHVWAVLGVIFVATVYFQFSQKQAALVGLIFGVHPLSWLPVGAISYRQEILAVIFITTAIGCYIRAVTRNDLRWWIVTFVMWALALFAKEASLIWGPGLVLIWEFTQPSRSKRPWREWLGLLAIVVIYGFLRKIAVPENWMIGNTAGGFATTLGTGIELLGRRIIEFGLPVLPRLSDVTAVKSIFDIKVATTLTFILATIWWSLLQTDRNWRRIAGFTLVALLPAIGLFYLPRLSSPHYGYLATVAAGVMAVQLFRQIKVEEHREVAQNLAGAWIILAFINTFVGGFRFQDDRQLFAPEVERDPQYREGAFYLGNYYWQNGDLIQAEKYFTRALEKNDGIVAFVDRPAATINLAGVELNLGKRDKAIELLREVVSTEGGPNRQLALYNLALMEFEDLRYAESLQWLNMMDATDRPEVQQLRQAVESARHAIQK
jgi:hypothetical protein